MATNTTNNLSELFAQKIFRIPDYQRGYSWEERQLNELWDDIDEIQPNSPKHYTGTIFLEPIAKDDNSWLTDHNYYNVVDGQQRLTTIMILLFELLKIEKQEYAQTAVDELKSKFILKKNFSGNSKIYKFGYRNDTNAFLQRVIFEDDDVILKSDCETAYTKNLRFAKTFFAEKIASLSKAERDSLYGKITTALMFDIRTIDGDLDVQAVFETMNNRGKPLTILEKLKNRLIYLNQKLPNDPLDKHILRNLINDAWGIIFAELAKNSDNVLDEDVFLSAHLSLYRTPKEATFSVPVAESKLFKMFCNKASKYPLNEDNNNEQEPLVDFDKISKYVKDIATIAPLWYQIHNSSLELVNKILILDSSKEIKIFLVALLVQKLPDEELNGILRNVELVLFRNTVPGMWVMDERSFANWARKIYNKTESIDSLKQELAQQVKKPADVQNMISGFNYLFYYVNGAKGFHRWNGLKYFLFEYEESLRKNNDDKKITISDYDNTSIEHIMPQNCDYWSEVYNVYIANFETDEDKRQAQKILINTLGNLTILKNGKNSELGNKPWAEKRKRYTTGSYNEIEVSTHQEWNAHDIDERGHKLLEFLIEKVGDDVLKLTEENKKDILYTESKYHL